MDSQERFFRWNIINNGTLRNVDNYETINKIELKIHQQKALYKMIHLENETIHSHLLMNGNFGILADDPGSGKSYCILAIIYKNFIYKQDSYIVQEHFGTMYVNKLSQKNKTLYPINLIVIPHQLSNQWKQYADLFFNDVEDVKVVLLNRRKSIDNYNLNINNKEIIILTSTMYNSFINKFEDVRISRVFFDECDTLNISSKLYPNADFFWYISSSLANLLFPHGNFGTLSSIARNNEINTIDNRNWLSRRVWVDGIKKVNFIKDLFSLLIHPSCTTFLKNIIVKNTSDEIINSFDILPPNIIYTLCDSPFLLRVLDGIVGHSVLQMLNAGNIQGAISNLGCIQNSESNIITQFTSSLEREIHNIKQQNIYLNSISPRDEEHKTSILESINKNLGIINDKYNSINEIKNRMTNNNICPICIDEVQNKSFVTCCKNSFCLKCLTKSLIENNKCPMCRSSITNDNIHTVNNNQLQNSSSTPKKLLTKEDAIMNIINSHQNINQKKFLIFSSHFESFTKITNILTENNISFKKLSGQSTSISNTIHKYNNGEIKVLLLNSTHHGTGLNLEKTTDLIFYHQMSSDMNKQIIGRAQRLGRNSQLNIHHLHYKNEINTLY